MLLTARGSSTWAPSVVACLLCYPGCSQLLEPPNRAWQRCASVPKVKGSNLSGGSESTLCSDLLLTARVSRSWAPIVVNCLLRNPGNTLCSQRLKPPIGLSRQFNKSSNLFYFIVDYNAKLKTQQLSNTTQQFRQKQNNNQAVCRSRG
jgi:hypothetical protein